LAQALKRTAPLLPERRFVTGVGARPECLPFDCRAFRAWRAFRPF